MSESAFDTEFEAVEEAIEAALANPCKKTGFALEKAADNLQRALSENGRKNAHIGKASLMVGDSVPSYSGDTLDEEGLVEAAKQLREAVEQGVPEKKEDAGSKNRLVADAVGRAKRDMNTQPHRTPGREPY